MKLIILAQPMTVDSELTQSSRPLRKGDKNLLSHLQGGDTPQELPDSFTCDSLYCLADTSVPGPSRGTA